MILCTIREEWPMSFWKSVCVILNFFRIRNTHFQLYIFCPSDFVEHRQHWHEDDSISEMFTSDPVLCHRLLDFTKQIQCCVCAGKYSTRTRLILRRFRAIHDIHEISWTIQLILPKVPSNEDVHEICQDKAQNQSERVPLLSTTWSLCHVSKSFSSMELYSIQISHPSDSGLISVKYRNNCLAFSKSVFLVVHKFSW